STSGGASGSSPRPTPACAGARGSYECRQLRVGRPVGGGGRGGGRGPLPAPPGPPRVAARPPRRRGGLGAGGPLRRRRGDAAGRLLARRGAAVTGVDLSPALIERARAREASSPLGITYLVADAADLSAFGDASFDRVTANMVLMDMADAGGALREAARLLRPG